MAKAKKLDDSQLEGATGGVASNMGADASMGDQSIPGQEQKGPEAQASDIGATASNTAQETAAQQRNK